MANPRYNAVARRLTTLPAEVVHQVLNDLDVIKVLEIVCSNNHPHIDHSVQSHRQLSRLLPPQKFAKIKEAFTLYHEICRSRRPPLHPHINALKRDAAAILSGQSDDQDVLSQILNAIRGELELFTPHLPHLSKFAAVLPAFEICNSLTEVSDLRAHWDAIHGAEVSLNQTKSAQLNRLADLIIAYPGYLKSISDNSQEPRNNPQHQARMLREAGQRMLKPQLADRQIMSAHIFGQRRFPLVPYDRYLKLFLRVIEKFPLEAPKNILTGRPKYELVYKWPGEVADDINKIIQGLPYVYEGEEVDIVGAKKADEAMEQAEDEEQEEQEQQEDKAAEKTEEEEEKDEEDKGPGQLLRTKYTKYSHAPVRKSRGHHQPCFVGLGRPTWDLQRGDGVMPLEEKEFEWLEAFLRVCKHMSGLTQVWWSAGRSVADFWALHARG
ncbi:hypothetical protein AX16_008586 [Volvariella volvacea WC 439]|nr:hypothetical protein AX16_008586 [Volvariella volvacea WC 439]